MSTPIDIEAVVRLGRALRAASYSFVTVTPETHRRVDARASAALRHEARSVRDVFGWSRPFREHVLPPQILELARKASVLRDDGGLLRATVRFTTLGGHLFVHSAHPTTEGDAVFFGPDTYRYCDLVETTLATRTYRRLVDVGAGSGAGGICASASVGRIVLADINAEALRFAEINAVLAGAQAKTTLCSSDVLSGVEGSFDLVIANPPFLFDPLDRKYRHGGGELGQDLALRIAREALERLDDGGTLVLYTGAAIVDGEDVLLRSLRTIVDRANLDWSYRELDPDIFGEEIENNDAYAAVERIAAVGLVANKR